MLQALKGTQIKTEPTSKERFGCPGRKPLSTASPFFSSALGVFAPVLLLEAFLVFPHLGAAMSCTSEMKPGFRGARREV